MVQQSNVYFERCHAADFNPGVDPATRRACWARWMQYYAEGQPPDRVRHARERLRAIESGGEVEPLPGMPQAVVDSSYTASFLAIEQTQTAADEGTDDPPDADAQAAQPAAEVPQIPPVPRRSAPRLRGETGACSSVCEPRWQACIDRCAEGSRGCERACQQEHQYCVRACY